MKVIITESQVRLLRRLNELGPIVDEVIMDLYKVIKSGGPGNKPDNFGVYERWVANSVKLYSGYDYFRYTDHDFMMLVMGNFNDKVRKGYNKVK